MVSNLKMKDLILCSLLFFGFSIMVVTSTVCCASPPKKWIFTERSCRTLSQRFVALTGFGSWICEDSEEKGGGLFFFDCTREHGCSYGPWRLSTKTGGMKSFFVYLEERAQVYPAVGLLKKPAIFLKELNDAGGLRAAEEAMQNGGENSLFVKKFRELSDRDWQFVEYQLASILHSSDMTNVQNWFKKRDMDFDKLEPAMKDAVFFSVARDGWRKTIERLDYAMNVSTERH